MLYDATKGFQIEFGFKKETEPPLQSDIEENTIRRQVWVCLAQQRFFSCQCQGKRFFLSWDVLLEVQRCRTFLRHFLQSLQEVPTNIEPDWRPFDHLRVLWSILCPDSSGGHSSRKEGWLFCCLESPADPVKIGQCPPPPFFQGPSGDSFGRTFRLTKLKPWHSRIWCHIGASLRGKNSHARHS